MLRRGAFVLALLALSSCRVLPAQDQRGSRLQLQDAERFAQVFEAGKGAPDETALQRGYLDPASPALSAYVPEYIVDAATMAKAVSAAPGKYRHAVETCLPLLAGLAPFLEDVQMRHADLIPDAQPVDVVALLGADNSAGTVVERRIVLGLERVCDGIDDEAGLRERLRWLVAHEWVHAQQPGMTDADRRSLPAWALREGVANFLAAKALGGDAGASDHEWAVAREAGLWREFQRDAATMREHWPPGGEPDARAIEAGTRWMWNDAEPEGRPADLGYWIGQRIVAAWFARQPDKEKAARELLRMESPEAFVEGSGYAP